jgi:tRNA A37 methylthiotransferase MiaB
MKKAVGTKVNVLFEHTANDNLMKGFSDNYIRVAAPFNEQYINNIVRVKLSDMREGFCYGEIKG